ncbi:hypothetical protein EA758_01690 [Acinetobacter pittii]|uniref:Uncharacterized protein n=1 Tax=Acinetobacter pittii TaxID=48296 RepID=A0AB37TFP0_ACIPI|nr:hypothetical protein [Acinetobacter pittii]RSO23579.1 hypothetical protein EA764_15010 [Acinetobacter pittii]RSO56834.1 hypothetical protein EA758_01690 [Acinetobacter pittii]RSO59052.1 hypothetical protein EA752_12005 [Acinetobacter pittii]RZH06886.1 hypothetical protein EXE00_11465 [Acinetobacter pittii]
MRHAVLHQDMVLKLVNAPCSRYKLYKSYANFIFIIKNNCLEFLLKVQYF